MSRATLLRVRPHQRRHDVGRLAGRLGGWRAICWFFAPLYLVMAIAVAFGGGGGDSFSANFVSIDRHSGVAGGDAPVPDPKVAASDSALPPAAVSQVTRLD